MLDRMRGESGQVLILFALMLVVLVGGTGLIIDGGYAYAQKRQVQNAADAAALAGARYLAANRSSTIGDATMLGVLDQYATANASASTVSGYYVAPDGSRVAAIGSGYSIPGASPTGAPAVSGVQVVVQKTFNTVFMRVLNVDSLSAAASATGQYGEEQSYKVQPTNGPAILPMVFDQQTLNSTVACTGYGGTPSTYQDNGSMTNMMTAYNCGSRWGGFSWSPLNVTSSNSNQVIKDLLHIPSPYAADTLNLGVGVNIQVSPGTRAVDYADLADNFTGQDVLVPIVDHRVAVSSGCPNCNVPIAAFAWYHVSSSDRQQHYMTGYWVDPRTKPPVAGQLPTFTATSYAGPVAMTLTH